MVVYLRAQQPVRRATRPPEIDFPVNLLIRTEPAPVERPVLDPDRRDTVAYGKYLVEIAGCVLCHTPTERGRPIPGQEFSGGRDLFITYPEGRARSVSANITPDPETGYFGFATRDDWIARVRSVASLRAEPPTVERGRNTMMPWLEYAGLSDEDLGAIYDFMRTVRPIRKVVERFPDALGVTVR